MTSCDQTKNGSVTHVRPGARCWTIVTSMLIAPSVEDSPIRKMPTSQNVCPVVASTARGAYAVQPELAAPPVTKKLATITSPAAR